MRFYFNLYKQKDEFSFCLFCHPQNSGCGHFHLKTQKIALPDKNVPHDKFNVDTNNVNV